MAVLQIAYEDMHYIPIGIQDEYELLKIYPKVAIESTVPTTDDQTDDEDAAASVAAPYAGGYNPFVQRKPNKSIFQGPSQDVQVEGIFDRFKKPKVPIVQKATYEEFLKKLPKIYQELLLLCKKWRDSNKLGKMMKIGKEARLGDEEHPLFRVNFYDVAKLKNIDLRDEDAFEIPKDDPVRSDKRFQTAMGPLYYLSFRYGVLLVDSLNAYLKNQNISQFLSIHNEGDGNEDLWGNLELIKVNVEGVSSEGFFDIFKKKKQKTPKMTRAEYDKFKKELPTLYRNLIFICRKWRDNNKFTNAMWVGKTKNPDFIDNEEEFALFRIDFFKVADAKGINVHDQNFMVPADDPIRKDEYFDELQEDDPMYYLNYKYGIKLCDALYAYMKKQYNGIAPMKIDFEGDKYEDMTAWLEYNIAVEGVTIEASGAKRNNSGKQDLGSSKSGLQKFGQNVGEKASQFKAGVKRFMDDPKTQKAVQTIKKTASKAADFTKSSVAKVNSLPEDTQAKMVNKVMSDAKEDPKSLATSLKQGCIKAGKAAGLAGLLITSLPLAAVALVANNQINQGTKRQAAEELEHELVRIDAQIQKADSEGDYDKKADLIIARRTASQAANKIKYGLKHKITKIAE